MSRTVGHDYQENYGYKLYKKGLKERKYGERARVRRGLRNLRSRATVLGSSDTN